MEAPPEERERPSLRIAEPPSEGTETVADAAARDPAELARGVERAADDALEQLRRRTEAASRELGMRRQQMEAEGREEERNLPGAASMGLELAVGALRLVGAMVTAPVRIGLAFLRPREA